MVARGEGCREVIIKEFGMERYTLLYLKWITNNVLQYSTGNSAQCYVAAWMGEKFGEQIHVYVWLSPFAVHLKLLIGCTSIQIKSFKKEKKINCRAFLGRGERWSSLPRVQAITGLGKHNQAYVKIHGQFQMFCK